MDTKDSKSIQTTQTQIEESLSIKQIILYATIRHRLLTHATENVVRDQNQTPTVPPNTSILQMAQPTPSTRSPPVLLLMFPTEVPVSRPCTIYQRLLLASNHTESRRVNCNNLPGNPYYVHFTTFLCGREALVHRIIVTASSSTYVSILRRKQASWYNTTSGSSGRKKSIMTLNNRTGMKPPPTVYIPTFGAVG